MNAPHPLTGDELAAIKARALDASGVGWWEPADRIDLRNAIAAHFLGNVDTAPADALHIISASPATTLRLVAEVERLRGEVRYLRAAVGGHPDETVLPPLDEETVAHLLTVRLPLDIGEPLARHSDGTLNTDPVCICHVPRLSAVMDCPVHYAEHLPPATP